MNRAQAVAELASMQERADFLRVIIAANAPKPPPPPPYGCQAYDINRLCRFDRRMVDRKCDGCRRLTDQIELTRMGLWLRGVSHG